MILDLSHTHSQRRMERPNETANGAPTPTRVDVETIRRLITDIEDATKRVRDLIAHAGAETYTLFGEALKGQRDGLDPQMVEVLTDSRNEEDPEWQEYAREWIAWAQVHLNTLMSVEILAASEAASAPLAAAR